MHARDLLQITSRKGDLRTDGTFGRRIARNDSVRHGNGHEIVSRIERLLLLIKSLELHGIGLIALGMVQRRNLEFDLLDILFGDLHGNIIHRHGTNLIKVESRNRDLGADISLHRPALVRQRHESLGIQRRHMACIILVDEPVPVVAAARQQGGTYERRGKK